MNTNGQNVTKLTAAALQQLSQGEGRPDHHSNVLRYLRQQGSMDLTSEGTAGPQQTDHGPPIQYGLTVPFLSPAQQQQIVPGPDQLVSLDDALSYINKIKEKFVDHPNTYRQFLEIMQAFKECVIDTAGVIDKVCTLLHGNTELILEFSTFLPPSYSIECGAGDDPSAIRSITPAGVTVHSMPIARQNGRVGPRLANDTFTPQSGGAQSD